MWKSEGRVSTGGRREARHVRTASHTRQTLLPNDKGKVNRIPLVIVSPIHQLLTSGCCNKDDNALIRAGFWTGCCNIHKM